MQRGQSLFECVAGLRYYGAGASLTRSIYKFPATHWIVKKVVLSKDQKHGVAWGTMVWRGRVKERIERIPAPLKKEWSLVAVPDYTSFRYQKDWSAKRELQPQQRERVVDVSSEETESKLELH